MTERTSTETGSYTRYRRRPYSMSRTNRYRTFWPKNGYKPMKNHKALISYTGSVQAVYCLSMRITERRTLKAIPQRRVQLVGIDVLDPLIIPPTLRWVSLKERGYF